MANASTPMAARGPVLVTGAGGFVGSWLLPELVRAGCEVVATLRPGEPAGPTRASWQTCELTDPEAIRELVADVRPGSVIHLAAQAVPREATRSPLQALRTNYLAVSHLARALRDVRPAPRLLFVSTGEVYGRRPADTPPLREGAAAAPENVYGATKLASEQLLAVEAERHGLDVVRVRPFNHTGPGRPQRYAESSFARQIALAEAGRAKPCVRVGNLSAIRDFSDVRDVVRAYVLLVERGESGQLYNVCSGQGRTIESILELLVERARIPIDVQRDDARYEPTPADRVALVGDASELRARGWTPTRRLEDTLGELLDAWREREHVVSPNG